MVTEILDHARKTKQRATALRNTGSFERAIQLLQSLIDELSQSLNAGELSEPEKSAVRAEIADAYGMKGGTYRRWLDEPDHLSLALQQYTEGAKYERLDSKSTYNASNMITLAVALRGKSPGDPELAGDLDRVIKQLESDTQGSRADEWWAWSDLAQFYLLRNDIEKARAAYRRAMRTGPTAAERRRHVEVLRELSHALEPRDKALATNIGNVADELDQDRLRELG